MQTVVSMLKPSQGRMYANMPCPTTRLTATHIPALTTEDQNASKIRVVQCAVGPSPTSRRDITGLSPRARRCRIHAAYGRATVAPRRPHQPGNVAGEPSTKPLFKA